MCGILVPEDPLSINGLKKPYILKSLTNNNNDCCVTKTYKTVFVEVVILDIISNTFYVYNPPVINNNSQIKIKTELPSLPQQYIIGIWFGSNNVTFKLLDSNNSLHFGNCADGTHQSIFGNFAYCNAKNFFITVNNLINSNNIKIPNSNCITSRSFEFNYQYDISGISSSYIITKDYKVVPNNLNSLNLYQILYIIIVL